MDPVTGKVAVRGIAPKPETKQVREKTQPSKFDKVRANLQEQQASQAQLPPPVTQISSQEKKMLESQLRKKLNQARSPSEVMKTDMNGVRTKLTDVASRVNALPKTTAMDPIRNRLANIESQFQQTGSMMQNLAGTANPGDLLKMQVQMYQMTQNLEIVSKVVEQMSSGVKSILQTQI